MSKWYIRNTSTITCCKGCTPETGRSTNPNCHSYCEKYLAEKAKVDEYNAKYNEYKKQKSLEHDYLVTQRQAMRTNSRERNNGR